MPSSLRSSCQGSHAVPLLRESSYHRCDAVVMAWCGAGWASHVNQSRKAQVALLPSCGLYQMTPGRAAKEPPRAVEAGGRGSCSSGTCYRPLSTRRPASRLHAPPPCRESSSGHPLKSRTAGSASSLRPQYITLHLPRRAPSSRPLRPSSLLLLQPPLLSLYHQP